jgi:hypothetical protein
MATECHISAFSTIEPAVLIRNLLELYGCINNTWVHQFCFFGGLVELIEIKVVDHGIHTRDKLSLLEILE